MNISFVCVEDGITALGFRKMVSFVKSIHPSTEACYIPLTNQYNPLRFLLKPGEHDRIYSDADLNSIASHFAKSDLVCFSSMTAYSDLTKEIIQLVKKTNPETYIIWGGIHPIVHPEDAIEYPDAICTGEGETAFKLFLSSLKNGEDYTSTKNFWFNNNGKVIKNDFLPLHTSEEMEKFPFMSYAEDYELIYKQDKGFVPTTTNDYLSSFGLGNTYDTIWSIGCPYKCTYCANNKFIENDKDYRKLRHPSVDYVIAEVKEVLKKHPHISYVGFQDDSFMAIPLKILNEFAEKWRAEISVPFSVVGVIPAFVKKEKVEVLVWGGMKRTRMGIQSGSDRILEFYDRPNKPGLIPRAASILASYTPYMIAPDYDLIIDNPIETRQDVIDTLNMVYNLRRPFNLNIFALRAIPNTELANDLMGRGVDIKDIKTSYLIATPTVANCMVFLLTVFRPPEKIYNYLLKYVKPFTEEQPLFPRLFMFCRALWMLRRAYYHLKYFDFSFFPGKVGWFLYHSGFSKFLKRRDPPMTWGPQT